MGLYDGLIRGISNGKPYYQRYGGKKHFYKKGDSSSRNKAHWAAVVNYKKQKTKSTPKNLYKRKINKRKLPTYKEILKKNPRMAYGKLISNK